MCESEFFECIVGLLFCYVVTNNDTNEDDYEYDYQNAERFHIKEGIRMNKQLN